jgi:hypothetical protein
VCCKKAGQQFVVTKICESEFATIDTHLVGFLCVLLGDGRQLLCSGGVSFGVRSGAQQWGGLFFGVRSEDPLVGKCGVFFGVRSGAVAWKRHLHNLKRFLWGLFWSV